MARKNDRSNLAAVIQVMEVTGALTNQRICVTGHMGLPRKEIHQIIVQAGGEVHDDVRDHTTILVSNSDWTATTIGEVNGGKKKSSKQIKAESNNRYGRVRTKIFSEDQFYQFIIDNGKTSQMPVED